MHKVNSFLAPLRKKIANGVTNKDIWLFSSIRVSLHMVCVSFSLVGRLNASKAVNRGIHPLYP